jgi:hypothetical protein
MILRTLALASALFASASLAQTPTSVDQAKADLDACLRANADLALAKTSGAPAAAKAALKQCKTEAGKLDRAVARASKDAGKTVTQNKAATAAARKAVLDDVEAFLARNLAQERGD